MALLRAFAGLLALACSAPVASATRVLRSTSLDTCQDQSSITANQFNVAFFPDNRTINARVAVISSEEARIALDVHLNVYGFEAMHEVLNPCELEDPIFCPLVIGRVTPPSFRVEVGDDVVRMVPGIGFEFPDLDASVRVYVNNTDTGETIGCVQARFSNDKTVDLAGIKWATAGVILLGLLTSAVMSALGHTNTAAHLAASTLSLFGYFQAQGIVSFFGVRLPPAAQAWTQNFVWSLGIIRIGWMQRAITWLQRATGGSPATLLHDQLDSSVTILKRGLDLAERGLNLHKRANIQLESGGYVVYGIQRTAYRANIESTNMFMTSIVFFCILVVIAALCVAIFQSVIAMSLRKGWIHNGDHLATVRTLHTSWQFGLRGVLLRMTFVGFPAIAIFSLWQFTQVDSGAFVAIAVFFFFGALAVLSWSAYQIIMLGRRSVSEYRTASYLLFSNPYILQQWGFLYIPFRASAYYYIAPVLGYIVAKACIVAFGQHNGTAQTVCMIVVEAAALIAASVLRPWMDKTTNALNIAICVINFLNAIFLFLLADVFGAPGLLVGITGILIFLVNAAFSLVLLLFVIGSSIVVFWRKNPDTRYRAMDDDRASFWQSKTQLHRSQELDALAVTARGNEGSRLDDYNDRPESLISTGGEKRNTGRFTMQSAASRSQLGLNREDAGNAPWSPVDPSMPLARNGEHQRTGSPLATYYDSPSRPTRGDAGSIASSHGDAGARGAWRPQRSNNDMDH